MLRAIVGARTSTTSDRKVSHTAQLETAGQWADTHGYQIVGTFEDLGVSASVAPQDRPDLGQWLTPEGASEWDAVIFSKMDRAFRSTRHCVDFAQWAEEHHKLVVFAEDGLTLDYRPGAAKGIDSMLAELFVYIGSFFAQMELNRFQTRAKDGHRVLRTTDRWASGVPPLGYRVVDHPSGKGKGLDIDPEGNQLLRHMAAMLLDGKSFIQITNWLNETGALTNMERSRIAKGKPPKGKPWTVGTIIEALTSPHTQGFKMHKDEVVLDHQGQPIRLAEPTFDSDTWKQIQEAATKRRINRRTPATTTNPLLGVGYCSECGASLAQQTTRKTRKDGTVTSYRTYRCGRTPINCKGISISAARAEAAVEMAFLYDWADQQVTKQVFVPGEDNAHELEQINQSIERLRRESDAGLITTPADEQTYLARMQHLTQRRDTLTATPTRKAGWVTETTGQTYAEAWGEPNGSLTQHHRQLLIDARIRFVLMPDKDWGISVGGNDEQSGNTSHHQHQTAPQ